MYSDAQIIDHYQLRFRGLAEYYKFATDRSHLIKVKNAMQGSLVKTLASKLKLSVPQVYRRYRTTIQTARGPRVALRVTRPREGKPPLVAVWGRTDLARKPDAVLNDVPLWTWFPRTELVARLLADTRELCGSREGVQVHHVRALKDLHRRKHGPVPRWVYVMSARQRKTLVVCHTCHLAIHHGPTRGSTKPSPDPGEPDDVKASRPVRWGAVGKGPHGTSPAAYPTSATVSTTS